MPHLGRRARYLAKHRQPEPPDLLQRRRASCLRPLPLAAASVDDAEPTRHSLSDSETGTRTSVAHRCPLFPSLYPRRLPAAILLRLRARRRRRRRKSNVHVIAQPSHKHTHHA